jgi:predicted RNA polymerase sigma factor
VGEEPPPGPTEQADDTLLLLFLCCHPELTPASAVALTLRAVGGLTTREIAEAFMVPEAAIAQRISRAKRTVGGKPLRRPGDMAVVLRVLYLIYSAGHAGRVDLAAEAIRLTRQLIRAIDEPEVRGLLALMLLHHARRPARFDANGALVPLDQQDRRLWDTSEIAEGVLILQSALGEGRRGPTRCRRRSPRRTTMPAPPPRPTGDRCSSEWYDEPLALAYDPAAALSRAVAVGHVLSLRAGLREVDRLQPVLGGRHRFLAVRAYLHKLAGELDVAADLCAEAAARATNVLERDHLVRRAASLRAGTSAHAR